MRSPSMEDSSPTLNFGLEDMMTPQYDIFRMKKGEYVWLEATMTLDDAQARVQELGAAEPGEYVIFDEKNCDRISLIVEHRQTAKAQ